VPWCSTMRLHRTFGLATLAALAAMAGCVSSSAPAPAATGAEARPASPSEAASAAPSSAPPAATPAPESPTVDEAELAEEAEPPPSAFGDSLAILNDSRRRGTLSSARIEAGISHGEPAVGACVLAAAQLGTVEGRVVVSFLIEADGRVASAAYLVSTLTDDELARCVLEAVKSFEFPRPSGGVVLVSYPFQFRVTG
jgi:TonB family protein